MYESKYLIENQFALLSCKQFAETRVSLNFSNIQNYTQQQFIDLFDSRLKSLKHSKIIGLEDFSHKDAIIGCNHFIDNVLLQYTIAGIQTFEHDYRYYKKLHPNIIFATVETLQKDKPLLIAAPFPGHLGLHRQWNNIIARCEELKIPVYIDGAWFPPSFDITLDLSSPCIKEIAFSCSKAYGLGDNRIGVRYSRSKNSNDSITHMNERQMISHISYQIACKFLERFEYDHIVSLYKKDYLDMCKQLKLRPSNIINSAFSIDWRKLYGVSKVLPVL